MKFDLSGFSTRLPRFSTRLPRAFGRASIATCCVLAALWLTLGFLVGPGTGPRTLAEDTAKAPSAPEKQINMLYTCNNLGYTSTCG